MSTTEQAVSNERDYVLHTYPRPDFVLDHGEGVYLFDTEGRRYLDCVAGIAVNALGYGDREVAATISEHADKLIHVSNLYHSAPGGALAKALIEGSTGFDRVFFSNSGTESIEGAIKFARKYAHDHHGAGKTTVVAFDGSFHGRSMGAVAITAREKYREPFQPVMPGARFGTFNDVAALDSLITPDVCAVVIEPIQGEGGLRAATDEFLKRIRQLCDKHDALLICDEIQCGMGRTGTLWAHETYGLTPDIMTVAKPLGGGLPIGAILMRQKVADVIHPGDHGTTFGGGPLVTAVAQTVFNRISDPHFLGHVREVSSYLDEALGDLMAQRPEQVLELRGRGLMRGLRINGSAAAARAAGHDVGILIATAGDDVIRLLPPLIFETSHVDELIDKLGQTLDAMER